MKLDEKNTMLRATCAVPLLFPTIEIDGQPYYDGGIADPIPIRISIEDGNEKNLIILTQPEGYEKRLNAQTKFVAKRYKRKYPELTKALLDRHERYNETVRYCLELEKQGRAVVLRPEYKLDSLEKDVKVLRKNK